MKAKDLIEQYRAQCAEIGGTAVIDAPHADRPMRKGMYVADTPDEFARLGADDLLMAKSAEIPEPMRGAVDRFSLINDGALIVKALTGKAPREQESYHRLVHEMCKSSPAMKKNMDTATAASGLEWAPNRPSTQFFELYSAALVVASLFGTPIEMNGPVIPLPLSTTFPTISATAEQTVDQQTKVTATTVGTGTRNLTAKKMAGRIPYSNEMEEDSIIPFVPRIRADLAKALARAEDQAYVDGDTTNPHQDSDIVAGGTDVRTLFRGLRKHAIATGTTVDGSAFAASVLRAMVAELGADYSLAPVDDLVYICGAKVAHNRITALANDLKNPSDYAAGLAYKPAPGEIGRFDGKRVIGCSVQRETLNANGVNDATTNNKGVVLLVYVPAWIKGVRRPAVMRLFDDIIYEQKHLVVSYRGAFDTPWASEATVAMATNVSTA